MEEILLLTTSEAARRLHVSTSWLKKQVAAGKVPHTRLGRSVRFSAGQLLEIVQIGERRADTMLVRGRSRRSVATL